MTSRSSPSGTSLLLFDTRTDAPGDWRIINDTVMGGQSSSQFSALNDHARFSGTVSLDGGGFASVRSPSGPDDLGGADRFVLMVRGDGKTYNFTAYTEAGGRVSYRRQFEAPAEWTRIEIPFGDLTPYRRGRRVPSAPDFDPSAVREVGFLIGDRQEGPFRLDVAWIGGA
jgi:monofunctional biosynthetic peptidoglycan transglycosylase